MNKSKTINQFNNNFHLVKMNKQILMNLIKLKKTNIN